MPKVGVEPTPLAGREFESRSTSPGQSLSDAEGGRPLANRAPRRSKVDLRPTPIKCTSGNFAGNAIGEVRGDVFISHRKKILKDAIATDTGALQAAWDAGARICKIVTPLATYRATFHQIKTHGFEFDGGNRVHWGDQWALPLRHWSVEAKHEQLNLWGDGAG